MELGSPERISWLAWVLNIVVSEFIWSVSEKFKSISKVEKLDWENDPVKGEKYDWLVSIKSRLKSNEEEYWESKFKSIKIASSLSKIFKFSSPFLFKSIFFSLLLFQGKIFWILSSNPGLEFNFLPAESVMVELLLRT